MSKTGAAMAGPLLTAGTGPVGHHFNAIDSLEIVLHIAATGVIAAWATIGLGQLRLTGWRTPGSCSGRNFRCRFHQRSDAGFPVGVLILGCTSTNNTVPWMIATTVIGVPALTWLAWSGTV